MGRNKPIAAPKPHEIPCYGVLVEFDPDIQKAIPDPSEEATAKVKEYLAKVATPTKDMEAVLGMNTLEKGILVLVRVTGDGSDENCVKELVSKYSEMGITAKVAKERIFADGRYLKEPYAGFVCTIPPVELEEAILRILSEYCHDYVVYEDRKNGIVFYEGNLGGRQVTIGVQNGTWQMSAGLVGGQAYYTKDVRRHWPDVLCGLEQDIVRWQAEHPGLAKKPNLA